MSTYYLTAVELEQAARLYRTAYPKQAEASLLIAEQACRNEFIVPYTNDLTTWIPMGEPVDWLHNPSADPEFTWGINRHWHMLDLGKAYLMTKDEQYVRIFKEHLRSWREQNPPPSSALPYAEATFFQLRGPWRLLEVGLRVQSWISAYACMQTSRLLDEAFHSELLEGLEQHAHYLASYLGETEINHAIMHMQGLFMIAVFHAKHPRAPYWRQLAMERLQLCQLHQIGAEGIQTELTTHYHDASIEMFGTPYLLARLAGHPFPQAYGEQLHRMTSFTLAMIRPDGRSTAIGDSEWVSHGRARVAMLGGILQDTELIALGEVSPDFLWTFGAASFAEAEALQRHSSLEQRGQDFPMTGYYIMKSPGQHLFFDAAPMGGAHGHADALNIEWYWRRQLIFADPGRYTYEEGEWRHYFKSTAAHNTVLVDGQDQTPYISTQAWGEPAAQCSTNRRDSTVQFEFVDAAHNGYMRLADPVQHRRWLLLGKEVPVLLVIDWLDCTAEHAVQQRFQLHPACRATVLEDTDKLAARLDYPASDLNVAMHWAIGAQEQAMEIVREQSWVSEIYGSKTESTALAAKLTISGPAAIAALALPRDCAAAEEQWQLHSFMVNQAGQSAEAVLSQAHRTLTIQVHSGGVHWEMEPDALATST